MSTMTTVQLREPYLLLVGGFALAFFGAYRGHTREEY